MQARSIAAALIVSAGVIASASAQDVPKTNCDLKDAAWRAAIEQRQEASPGPFRLEALHCQTLFRGHGLSSFATVSPNLNSIAVYSGHDPGYSQSDDLAVARLSSSTAEATHPYGVGALSSSSLAADAQATRPPVRWSADSRTLWSATQKRAGPGYQAAGPVRPIRFENGTTHELPEIVHPAGAMDALLWTSDGRALALFGDGLAYYRPVPDPNPSLAFVDAVNGRVIETLPLKDIITNPGPRDRLRYFIGAAEVVGLPDGRLRAFVRISGQSWVVWTQGEPPRYLPDPYPAQEGIKTAISADGARVLVVRTSHRVTQVCPRAPPCWPPGPPVDGVLAALYDLDTGRTIWTHRVRITSPGLEYPTPELSDDGRYALIGLPPNNEPIPYDLALISMRDGSVQQRFPVAEGGKPTMGFARGSRRMWINISGLTTVYTLQ